MTQQDDLRDLIAAAAHERIRFWQRQGYVVDGIDDADIADAILAALDAAGWTIVKRNTALTAAGDNPHDAPLARAALRVQAFALAAFQQTTTTLNPDSIPAGEADAPTGGGTDSQQQEDM